MNYKIINRLWLHWNSLKSMVYVMMAKKRYKKENPPGYKDAKKKDGIRKYSDLIWWKEVIQYARKSRKNIVLVTDDVKEDWWTIDEKGQYLFRGELITEFEKETKLGQIRIRELSWNR